MVNCGVVSFPSSCGLTLGAKRMGHAMKGREQRHVCETAPTHARTRIISELFSLADSAASKSTQQDTLESNQDPLDFIQRDLVAGTIVEFGCAR